MKHENKIKYEERWKTGRERGQVNGNRQKRTIVKGKGKIKKKNQEKIFLNFVSSLFFFHVFYCFSLPFFSVPFYSLFSFILSFFLLVFFSFYLSPLLLFSFGCSHLPGLFLLPFSIFIQILFYFHVSFLTKQIFVMFFFETFKKIS